MAVGDQPALTEDEREGICLAVRSAFTKLKNLYQQIRPICESYGFAYSLSADRKTLTGRHAYPDHTAEKIFYR